MTIKKAELHSHLEGTISPELARVLAKRNNLPFPAHLIKSDGESYHFTDFLDFLKNYDAIAALIKAPRDYYDITLDYLKRNAQNNCLYVELMYSPDHAEFSSGIPSTEHLVAIQEAIDEAEVKFNIIGRLIITAVRHFGAEAAIKVAKQALKEQQNCIVGFGLGGDEVNFPPRLFAQAYKIAANGGLYCTVHAGEFAPAALMCEAMDYLPIQRIGHGVQAIHSDETIARLIERDIALEICPSSNIALGLFKDFASHPLPKLKDAGIKISLGSDDPPFFSTNLTQEYELVQKNYRYTDAQMEDFTAMAIDSSFADEKTKEKLKLRLKERFQA